MRKESISNNIFIGNVTDELTEASVVDYCSTFGPVSKCQLMHDPASGKSRRFGFVKFKESTSADKFISTQPHYIGNRHINIKAVNEQLDSVLPPSKRIFVSCSFDTKGIPLPEPKLFEYLATFGAVKGVVHSFVSSLQLITNRYWIVEFVDQNAVERCINQQDHVIDNIRIQIKKVLSSEDAIRRKREIPQNESERNIFPQSQSLLQQPGVGKPNTGNLAASMREYIAAPILSEYGYHNTEKRFKSD